MFKSTLKHKFCLICRYYNSRFDLPSAIKMGYTGKSSNWYDQVTDQARNLTEVATVLAKFLYNLATSDNATDVITVNETTVSLYAYMKGHVFTLLILFLLFLFHYLIVL